MNLAAIFKDSKYKLSQFTLQENDILENTIFIKKTKNGDVPDIQYLVRSNVKRLRGCFKSQR
jgi:hypothetical protein